MSLFEENAVSNSQPNSYLILWSYVLIFSLWELKLIRNLLKFHEVSFSTQMLSLHSGQYRKKHFGT